MGSSHSGPARRGGKRPARLLVLLALVAAACGGAAVENPGPDLPSITVEEFTQHMAELDQPAIVNVWASWCLPCRSESPLFAQAHDRYGGQIRFIGLDVQDTQAEANAFIAEFGLDYDHYFDPNRSIPNHLGGIGTPITFFFAPGGELLSTHLGVIDERTLALQIDELLRLAA